MVYSKEMCKQDESPKSIGSAHKTLRDTSVIVKHSDLPSVFDVSFFLFSFGSFLFFPSMIMFPFKI